MPVGKYIPAVIEAIRIAEGTGLKGPQLVDAIINNLCRALGGQVIYFPQRYKIQPDSRVCNT